MTLPARIDAPTGAWVDLVKPAADLAAQIARTDFVPEAMRNNPAAITACILYGHEIGLGPMQALAKVNVIKGRPAPSAELGRALALAHGHDVWVEESTATRVVVCGRRSGSDVVQKVVWTMDDVKRAGLSGQQYQRYPRQMLLARASAELVRQMCPDALGGITLFAEEVGAEVDGDTADTPTATAAPAKQTRSRIKPAELPAAPPPPLPDEEPTTPVTPEPPDEQPPLPDEVPAEGGITASQVKFIQAAFGRLGVTERADKLSVIGSVLGRVVGSSKELTRDQGSTVIDALSAVEEGSRALVVADDGTVTVSA